jgi:F0F1-type ATP synthase membrane subunit c/vacuolar-type H+-ATPase subunit K
MSDQPRGTVIRWRALGGHVAIGAAVGFGIGGAAATQAASSNEDFLGLLRVSMYLGAILAIVVWAIRVGQEKTRREVARLREWRWHGALRKAAAREAEETQRPRVRSQLLSHLSYGLRTGLAYGAVEAALQIVWGDGRWLLALLGFTLIGVVAGTFVWVVRVIDEDSRPTGARGADPLGIGEDPQDASAPFESRLAGFLHCDVEELGQVRPRPVSKMPFWSIVDFGSYIGPKPVQLIREFLERIHAAVHGPSHHDGNAAR